MPPANSAHNVSKAFKTHPAKYAVLGALMLTMAGLWFKIIFLAPASVSAKPAGNSQNASNLASKDKPMLSASRKQFFEWRRQNSSPLRVTSLKSSTNDSPMIPTRRFPERTKRFFGNKLAKSMDYRTDQEIARKNLVESLRKQAHSLRPKAILSVNGSQTALIDGSLANEGDLINGFRIVRIQEDRLIVEREGVRLEVLTTEN